MEIKVTTIAPANRRFILAQWDDPVTGRTQTRSTKTSNQREADRFAAALEKDLNAGTHQANRRMTYDAVKARYEKEYLQSQRLKTRRKAATAFNALEEFKKPLYVGAIDKGFLSLFKSHLIEKGLSLWTVRGYLTPILTMMNWAAEMEFVAKSPTVHMPSPGTGSKGRAPTLEEFERMLMVTEKIVRPEHVDGWKHLMEGIWLSSLRIEEAMRFHWTRQDEITIDLSGRYPKFRIQSDSDKGKVFRLMPMTPDFADFLLKTPHKERRGYVFKPFCGGPHRSKVVDHRPSTEHVGKVITKIGKTAGVFVNARRKPASAHDLRRAFGTRWSLRVMPVVLQKLMRHADIKTTMQFYATHEADDVAHVVWNAPVPTDGNTFGNTGLHWASPDESEREEIARN